MLFFFLLSSHASAQIQRALDSYLNDVYQSHVIPGFSVVVVNKENVIYSKGFGKEKLDRPQPFTPRSISAIGSLTKSLTATAIMQLVEQGKMKLDVPIVNYLPWFKTANKEVSDKVTVRMLLNNTSGLHADLQPTYDITDRALESLARSLEGSFIVDEPGSSYNYNNLGFSIAGLLIHKVSALPYMDYLEKFIFKPLEMQNTTTNPDKFNVIGALEGHFHGIEYAFPALRETHTESGEYIPAGSITRSNAEDLGHYLITLLNQGRYKNRQLLSPESIKEMWTPDSSFPGLTKEQGGDNAPIHYGLGWMISEIEGRRIIHHGGSTGKMSSMIMIDPQNKLAVALLANVDLTFIDQYRYPTIFSVVNNVLHLANMEPVSQYGKPTIEDPSVNDFELETEAKEKYLGEYTQIRGGDHWINFGLTLSIVQEKKTGLKAILSRGTQIINMFRLDFVNPSQAISRNMGVPQQVRFKITPDEKIAGLFCSGVEYIKINEARSQSYRTVNYQNRVQFLLPNNWKFTQTAKGFHANEQGNPSNQIKGIFNFGKDDSISKAPKEPIMGQVIFEGPEHNQIGGGLIWKHRSILTTQDDHFYMLTSFESHLNDNQISFTISTNQESHTLLLQQVMVPLLRSLQRKM